MGRQEWRNERLTVPVGGSRSEGRKRLTSGPTGRGREGGGVGGWVVGWREKMN